MQVIGIPEAQGAGFWLAVTVEHRMSTSYVKQSAYCVNERAYRGRPVGPVRSRRPRGSRVLFLMAVAGGLLLFSCLAGNPVMATGVSGQGALQPRHQLALPSTYLPSPELRLGLDLAEGLPSEGEATSGLEGNESAQAMASQAGGGGEEKSPGRAFIFSMLAPGSGQLYVGSKTGFIYLGVEAVAWTSSYFFWKSGSDKEDEYMDFADKHWTIPELGTPYGDGLTFSREDSARIAYFRENDEQHYYEDIGKYQVYIIGWDTWANLEEYLDMRDDSNRLLKNSGYAMMAALVNHVVSAVDALRIARNHNVKLGYGIDLDIQFEGGPHSTGVMLVASRKF